MAFLFLGVILLVLKLAGFGPVGAWDWWLVLLPFALATAWWGFSDWIGLTQSRAMNKAESIKAARRNRSIEALGLDRQGDRKGRASQFPAEESAKRSAKDPSSAADDAGRR